MATCNTAMEYAATNPQRLHTLLSLMSAALDMRRWDAVERASANAQTFLPSASPEEAARAQALRAHAAYFQGDMRSAIRLAQASDGHGGLAAQRAAALNIQGMIETALGDYRLAAKHLAEAETTAADFGHGPSTYMIGDSLACLAAARGDMTVRSRCT